VQRLRPNRLRTPVGDGGAHRFPEANSLSELFKNINEKSIYYDYLLK
jgi:hypothetical protein